MQKKDNTMTHAPITLTLSTLAAFGLAIALPQAGRAQTPITFGPAQTITGDTNVVNTGTTFLAESFGNTSSATVNGVTFTGVTDGNSLGKLAQSGFDSSATGAFTSAAVPFANLSASYRSLLGNAFFNGSGSLVTFTVSGLTVGNVYEAQFFVSDPRLQGVSRSETFAGVGGTTLNYNSTSSDGGVGQYAVGLFTAGASGAATFGVTANRTSQANAFQVRDLGPAAAPEPSQAAALSLGVLGLAGLALKARKRQGVVA